MRLALKNPNWTFNVQSWSMTSFESIGNSSMHNTIKTYYFVFVLRLMEKSVPVLK